MKMCSLPLFSPAICWALTWRLLGYYRKLGRQRLKTLLPSFIYKLFIQIVFYGSWTFSSTLYLFRSSDVMRLTWCGVAHCFVLRSSHLQIYLIIRLLLGVFRKTCFVDSWLLYPMTNRTISKKIFQTTIVKGGVLGDFLHFQTELSKFLRLLQCRISSDQDSTCSNFYFTRFSTFLFEDGIFIKLLKMSSGENAVWITMRERAVCAIIACA